MSESSEDESSKSSNSEVVEVDKENAGAAKDSPANDQPEGGDKSLGGLLDDIYDYHTKGKTTTTSTPAIPPATSEKATNSNQRVPQPIHLRPRGDREGVRSSLVQNITSGAQQLEKEERLRRQSSAKTRRALYRQHLALCKAEMGPS